MVAGGWNAPLINQAALNIKKRYWGRHFWARGYFCVTAGELTKAMIEEYLEHHFESRENPNFEIES